MKSFRANHFLFQAKERFFQLGEILISFELSKDPTDRVFVVK
ncbi:MAG: hypothetical protein AAF849_11675 [Bacteroidota bacterium]